MQQLSHLDTRFLHLESHRSPMHIGCILNFVSPPGNAMTFERFSRHVAARLSCSPVFRRRLTGLPLGLDRPYWVEDRQFRLDRHLQQVSLPATESAGVRTDRINGFFSESLSRDKPLWEMRFVTVEGDQSGEFSVLMKFHHAALDGVSAEKVLAALLSPNARDASVFTDAWRPEFPSLTLMAANCLKSFQRASRDWKAFASHLGHSMSQSLQLRSRDGHAQPPVFFMAPNTPFNGKIEAARHLCSAHLSLAKIKAIKNAHAGTTVNDVVLAICAGALRRHLDRIGQLPDESLVAMVPVNKRQGGEQQQGNLVSAMLVSLATDLDSPLQRLKAVHQNAECAKEYQREVALEEVFSTLPLTLSSLLLKGFVRSRLGAWLRPVFNLIVTNVPGSPVPLYLDGARLVSLEGTAPIVDGMGLTLVVTSYVDMLTVSITSTADQAEQLPLLVSDLYQSLQELHALSTPAIPAVPMAVVQQTPVAAMRLVAG